LPTEIDRTPSGRPGGVRRSRAAPGPAGRATA